MIRQSAAAAAVTRAAYAALRHSPPGGTAWWARKNYAGRQLELYGGLAAAAGAAVGTALAPGAPARVRAAGAVVTAMAAASGAYDDQRGSAGQRGFRAHLGALRRGEVTSGAVKLFGIGAAGLAAGAVMERRPLDKVLAGVVIAGTAHMVNLVDVRPGRAAKAVIALGGVVGARAAAPVAAAAAVLADDLGERTMLGDAGAHALGAALGVAAVAAADGRAGLAVRAAALVALVALAAVGDTVSYSQALWGVPGVRSVDAYGRRDSYG